MPISNYHKVSRRELLRGFRSDETFAKTQEVKTVERTCARPPNAVDESIFTRLCNQCGNCEQVCPEQVITLVDGMPQLDIDYNACTLCGKCQEVCPTIALSGTVQNTGLRVHIDNNCVNTSSYCDTCQDSCPANALIWHENNKPTINYDICSGCAICKQSCFIGSIYLVV